MMVDIRVFVWYFVFRGMVRCRSPPFDSVLFKVILVILLLLKLKELFMKMVKVCDELHTKLKVGASKNGMSIKAFVWYLFNFENGIVDELSRLASDKEEYSDGINVAIDFIKNSKEHDIDMAKTLADPAPFGKVKITGDIAGLTKGKKYAITVEWDDCYEVIDDSDTAVLVKKDGSSKASKPSC